MHQLDEGSLAEAIDVGAAPKASDRSTLLERVTSAGYELVWIRLPPSSTLLASELAHVRGRRDWAGLLQSWARSQSRDVTLARCAEVALAVPTEAVTTVIECQSHQGSQDDPRGGVAQERRRRSSEEARSEDAGEGSSWITRVQIPGVLMQRGTDRGVTLVGVGPGKGRLRPLGRWRHRGEDGIHATVNDDCVGRGGPRQPEEAIALAMTGCDPASCRSRARQEKHVPPGKRWRMSPKSERMQQRRHGCGMS